MIKKYFSAAMLLALILPSVALGQRMSTDAAIEKIKDEGMNRSQAMKTMLYLSDVIGARLTNSPSQRRANQWTKEQFEKWGLKNAMIDPWGEFGKSWHLKKFSAAIVAPEYEVIRAYPKAWSPSTNGPVTGNVIFIDANNDEELAKYKGKLKGAIILLGSEQRIQPGFEPTATRRSEKELLELEYAEPPVPQERSAPSEEQIAAARFRVKLAQFIFDEGAAAMLDPGFGVDAGTIRVMGANLPPSANDGTLGRGRVRVHSGDAPATIPQFVVEAEQFNRMLRRVRQGMQLKMQIDLDVEWDDSDLQAYNTLAEIPGTDLKDEVVMIGAHLDSWHAGTGATDNGAGTTVVMEAMRILAASGLKPRRTIRAALWTGEEQGLLGSRAYVEKTFGSRNEDGSIYKKPAYDKFAAYYNLDNGTGQIRGIYLQQNANARPIFRQWLMPFKEYGATTTTINNTGGTDHLAFDAIGLPGFQFIQDSIEYFPRTWHTTQDVADRTIEQDLMRSAVIMAAFAYNSAMTDQKLPRKTDESPIASLLAITAVQDSLEELAFRNSGMDFAICGHEIHPEEIPQGFPAVYAIRNYGGHTHNAE
ncbi:MAG: M20/M25/M40 family metallo-hydrolase [Acidobacteria bacterium]|nr:MAG: M20/M25/M40 family metallo-hydrolase [Acidobacteriota bacterium]REJ99247.1 MAG: M20/M25/M40 family metallo-hydrolase [Acidobacteriota bacterium]REK16032.1 MAG: M20/M25/M40 family metallo-hydrolase [Acidobacteriota bacterium]REK43713.1 MAG: M20/M25/M40 family metallo-hydrolase [Acidobacteriota bacterium]